MLTNSSTFGGLAVAARYNSFSHFGARNPGLVGAGAGAAAFCCADDAPLRLRPPPEDDTYETPEPGIPTDFVTLPEEWAETRAPRPPTDAPTPRGVTVMRTPGATLNDLRALNPMLGMLSALRGPQTVLALRNIVA